MQINEMLTFHKGDIYYFLNVFPNQDDFLYLKIESATSTQTKHGMATIWKVLETNKHWFEVGENYSGNQFQGVALYGLKNYLFEDQHHVVRHIFERKESD